MVLDDATFEKVVNAQYEPLYRFAFSLVQRESEARDLTQDVFTKLASKAHQIDDESRLKSWMFTTLYRAFLDSKRRDKRYPHVEMGAADAELPVSLPDAGAHLDAAAARQALMQVDEVYRAPMILFYLEDHSYLEIAEILDIPAGTVMSRISRGRASLRRLMEDKPPASVSPEKTKFKARHE